MSRAKTRRPGTRSGRRAESVVQTAPFLRPRKESPTSHELPDDLPDAAEAALDDLFASARAADRIEAENLPADPPKRAMPPPAPGARPATRPPRDNRPARSPARVATSGPVDESLLLEEPVLPMIDALSFAVFEDSEHVALARGGIV